MNVNLQDDPKDDFFEQESKVEKLVKNFNVKFQYFKDRIVPFVMWRWIAIGFLFILFMLRVILSNGWYVVAYCECIYLLAQVLLFLTPKFEPSDPLENFAYDDDDEDGVIIGETKGPQNSGAINEGGQFIRKLSEFNFWNNCLRSIGISIFLTFFRIFDIPVYVPILVVYFIMLSFLQFRKKVAHMIKYKYVPWSIGKMKK